MLEIAAAEDLGPAGGGVSGAGAAATVSDMEKGSGFECQVQWYSVADLTVLVEREDEPSGHRSSARWSAPE